MQFNGRGALALLAAMAAASSAAAQTSAPITVVTSDGVTIYGEPFFADLSDEAPLILAFHQGGSNGRGEYSELASWLNSHGYRMIAWDQRAGGSLYGSENRTVTGLGGVESADYCAASPDLEAALDHVTRTGLAQSVVLWGSSYSGSLVFRLAAERGDRVDGVVAFSPASGDPMVGCTAEIWVERVSRPMLVFRPDSEMSRPAAVTQRGILTAAGAAFHVVAAGVHGSSTLLDDRTGADMSEARALVRGWLDRVTSH